MPSSLGACPANDSEHWEKLIIHLSEDWKHLQLTFTHEIKYKAVKHAWLLHVHSNFVECCFACICALTMFDCKCPVLQCTEHQ